MLISLSHIPSWFPSTSSHTPIAQLIPQQQCSFVSYRWSPDRHSAGHITLSKLTLKSTNDWSLKHHAIYPFMQTKLSEIPSAPYTSICKWMPSPHDLGCIIIPSLQPNCYWSHIKRHMYFHHFSYSGASLIAWSTPDIHAKLTCFLISSSPIRNRSNTICSWASCAILG